MIASVKGRLLAKTAESVIIDVNGIGFEAVVPYTVINRLPSVNEEVVLFTYLHVREDLLQLYGFLEKEDLDFFKLLITVNGIGPKAAITVLSSMSADVLTFAILSEDIKTISKAQGIGAKTAKKLVLELKDKVGIINNRKSVTVETGEVSTASAGENGAVKAEAIEVLKALGYSGTEAMGAVSKVEMTESVTPEEVVRLALRNLG